MGEVVERCYDLFMRNHVLHFCRPLNVSPIFFSAFPNLSSSNLQKSSLVMEPNELSNYFT
jgi:hypothetical protein